MNSLPSILVDIDAAAAHHSVLEQAVGLAARCGTRVKVADVLPWVPTMARHFVTARIEEELVEHRRGALHAVAEGVNDVPVTVKLLRGRSGDALIQEVLRSSHDFLARSHERDLTGSTRPYGSVDMDPLRHCPCPVRLIGHHDLQPSPWRIVAAIHANPSETTEQTLNATILRCALILKDVDGAKLTVVQAWTAFGAEMLRSHMSSDDFAEFVGAARRTAQEAMGTITDRFKDRLTGVAVQSLEGEPEDVIAQFVESRGIDLVVMGTVARTRIAGLVTVSTTERVLRRLRGSVLAVKPPGFESPVARKQLVTSRVRPPKQKRSHDRIGRGLWSCQLSEGDRSTKHSVRRGWGD